MFLIMERSFQKQWVSLSSIESALRLHALFIRQSLQLQQSNAFKVTGQDSQQDYVFGDKGPQKQRDRGRGLRM
jgi:hypothetical protein